MRRGSYRLGDLTAALFVLSLQVSGQGTEPPLQDTMNFIANALNSRGTISWTETIPDVFGASYTINSSLTDVTANSSECSLKWISVYTSSDDKMVETYLVNLGTVSNVGVEPYSQYRKSEFQYKFEVSPETYVVVMKTDAPLSGNREWYHKSKLRSLFPSSLLDKTVWVVLSITAGFCEEFVYRGYLQQQFRAMTGSLSLAVVLQALAFGAAHLAFPWRIALMTVLLGLLVGTVAGWSPFLKRQRRKTLPILEDSTTPD